MITVGVDIRVLGTGRISGIEEYTEQLLAHMIQQATDVRWRLYYAGRHPLVRRSWMESASVTVHERRQSNRVLWLSTRLFGRPLLDRDVGGADVFFFPHFILGALSPQCRRVMTWHDLSYERMPELLSWHRRWWHAVQMRPRVQALTADRIIAVSQSTADDLRAVYGIPSERIAVVPSGIDPALRRAPELTVQRWRSDRGLDAPFVLAFGTREPRKNLPALIRAWDALRRDGGVRGVHLVLAGQRGWRERGIRRAIASTRVQEDVHILDGIASEERSLLLSAASVLVYPSLMEGFGFPPLEAMACGTPVIAGANSALIETVGNAGLLVDPYRVGDITVAMKAVLTDAGLYSRLVARGYEHAQQYTWQRAADATLGEIRSVLKR